MPDFPRFPLPPFIPGNEGDPHVPVTELVEELLRRRAARQPAPNPQEGVTELPPPSSNDPAPLPNPEGAYAQPYTPPDDEPVGQPYTPPDDEPVGRDYVPTGHYGAEPGPFGPEDDTPYDAPPLGPPGTGFREPVPSFGSGANPFMNIVAGERTGPRMSSPFPNDPINVPSPDIRIERQIRTRIERSDEFYRRQVERILKDTAVRQAGRVIEGIATPVVGGVIGGIIGAIPAIVVPGELGSGEAIPGFTAPMPAPPDIPAPVITQPEPLPLPAPSPVTLPAPSPGAPAPTSSAPAPAPSTTGSPAPTPAPARTRTPPLSRLSRVPWWTLISRTLGGNSQPWTTALPFAPGAVSPAPSPAPAPATSLPTGSTSSPAPSGTPLTGFNPQVSSSAPPTVRTRTRTRECNCDPKRRKRKKARECVVRGNLQWVSGPKKGKPAGSRCVKF